jgi:hypothetical protein
MKILTQLPTDIQPARIITHAVIDGTGPHYAKQAYTRLGALRRGEVSL